MIATLKPFISYSTNREDVLLNRLFGARDNGSFVDVGAAHPVYDNDTKALYDRGWTGINIEPNVGFFRQLVAERPRDRNLNLAVSDTPGSLTFHEVVGSGLSTCDADTVQHALDQGSQVIVHEVPAQTLRQILQDANLPQIDLLKIDVEGFELKVLASNDWDRFRPLLIITEATFPETPVRRPDQISPFLAERGYRHVYFDGLNDYYAERDFVIPQGVFDVPPNIFDNVTPYTQMLLTNARDSLAHDLEALQTQRASNETYVASLLERARALEIDLRRARQEIVALHQQITSIVSDSSFQGAMPPSAGDDALVAEIAALRASTSWRVTRPLRALARPRRTLRILLGGDDGQ
jgi:FkbM family methyltransferase